MQADLKLILARESETATPLETRTLASFPITIGRSASCTWALQDTEKLLSREHLTVSVDEGGIVVTDTSSNGVYHRDGERLPAGQPVTLPSGAALVFGGYDLVIEVVEHEDLDATMVVKAPAIEEDAPDYGDSPFEAFLNGAGLQADDIGSLQPEEALWLAGRFYRLLVENLSDLISDRSAIRTQVQAEQTMVGIGNANQLKMMKSETLASALFDLDREGFMDPVEAVEEGFSDLKEHQIAVLTGMQFALIGLFNRFDPDRIEEELAERHTMSVLAAGGKKSAAWDAFEEAYQRMREQLADYENSFFMRDFRDGYERRMAQKPKK